MKKKLYTLFFATFFGAIQLFANTVTVKGYVKQANGTAVGNTEVRIAVYLASSTTSCSEQTVTTNSAGFYSKELTCNGDIRNSRISLKNCDGTMLVQEKEVPVSKVVEVNFTTCQAPPSVCAAKFTAEAKTASSTVPAFSVSFNSNMSEVSAGDNIVERTWNFHDGSSLLSNRVDPTHTFPHSGTYEVCLTIKTAKGCESHICKDVVVQQAIPVTCSAKFTYEKLGPKKFRFNSATTLQESDKVVEQKWEFRDGTTSTDISPAHEFSKPGTYEVCLTIKTAKGCESRFCSVVKAEEAINANNAEIEITSVYPTPAHENLKTVIYSARNNVNATISVVDEFGVVRSSQKTTLLQGYNPVNISVRNLTPGSYFIRVATSSAMLSKKFYKL